MIAASGLEARTEQGGILLDDKKLSTIRLNRFRGHWK